MAHTFSSNDARNIRFDILPKLEEILRTQEPDFIIQCDASNLQDIIALNEFTHNKNIKFISSQVKGNTGFIFNDFGSNFTVADIDGETYTEVRYMNLTS